MFSGGVDSTLVASLLLEEYSLVHLITFDYGAELFIGNSRKSADALRRIYGAERVKHTMIDIRDWWLKAQIRNAKRFNLVCMSCKFVMHTRAIVYCLENEIYIHSDGSMREQSQHPEQMSTTLQALRSYYSEYSIDFTNPAYEFTTEEEDRRLAEIGLNFGRRLRISGAKGSHVHRQPFCLFAFFDVLFSDNPFFPHSKEAVLAHLRGNLNWGRELIANYFENKGEDLEQILSRRKRRYQRE